MGVPDVAVLQGGSCQNRVIPQQRTIHFVLLFGIGVNYDMMIVGIHIPKVLRHSLLLFGRLRVLFAQIPIQSQGMPEARDHFATI